MLSTDPTLAVPGDKTCKQCTVPTSGANVCDFCRGYQPPADTITDALIRAANYAHIAQGDVSAILESLPADVPLWATVDLVAARAHLAAAIKKLDEATDRINQAVTL